MKDRKQQSLRKDKNYCNIIAEAKKQQAIELNKKWEWAEKRILEIINEGGRRDKNDL